MRHDPNCDLPCKRGRNNQDRGRVQPGDAAVTARAPGAFLAWALIRAMECKKGKRMNDTNAFLGKTTEPTEKEVSSALGAAASAWNELLEWLKVEEQLSEREWNSYSPKYGWALRVRRKKRNIIYLSPCDGCFRVSFILGEKAVAAARASKLPKSVLKALDEAPKYPEGTGLRLTVSKSKDLPAIRTLTEVKLAS